MAKKLITFLGTNPYIHCKYRYKDNESQAVRYIQEALAEIICKDWKQEDKILVFATKGEQGSIKKNWENGEISRFDKFGQEFEKEPLGLQDRLKKLSLSCQIEMIAIPDGTQEGEIWEIIREINEQIEQSDELYFDITHSFRFIPMVIPSLISFLKTTKDITLKAIHYGAFEVLGSNQNVVKIPIEKRVAPIRELKELYKMIEWAEATNAFLQFGSGKDLINQLDNIEYFPKKVKSYLKPLKRNIQNIDDGLKYNDISKFKKKDTVKLGKKINLEEAPNLFTLKELSPKIENYINQWDREDDIKNGLLAAKWCLNNDRFAQSLTFAQEALINYFIKLLNMEDKKEYRSLINFIVQVSLMKKEKNEFSNSQLEDIYYKNIDIWLDKLKKIDKSILENFIKISEWRNIISHAKKADRNEMIDKFPLILDNIFKYIS